MISHLPYKNKLIYMLQSKLKLELPADLIHDIDYTLHDYGRKCIEADQNEKNYWKQQVLKRN